MTFCLVVHTFDLAFHPAPYIFVSYCTITFVKYQVYWKSIYHFSRLIAKYLGKAWIYIRKAPILNDIYANHGFFSDGPEFQFCLNQFSLHLLTLGCIAGYNHDSVVREFFYIYLNRKRSAVLTPERPLTNNRLATIVHAIWYRICFLFIRIHYIPYAQLQQFLAAITGHFTHAGIYIGKTAVNIQHIN